MIKYIAVVLGCFVLYSCSTTSKNRIDSFMPNEPGKCYAKCQMPDEYRLIGVDTFAVYTGEDPQSVELDSIVDYRPASTKWVKKKADRNCLSADPNDCLVWCLVETPEYRDVFYYLKDPSQTDAFRLEYREQKELIKKGGHTDWVEVLCESQINTLLLLDLQIALSTKGYDTGKTVEQKMHTKLKGALTKYQRENDLPIGQLDIATMESLNIKY